MTIRKRQHLSAGVLFLVFLSSSLALMAQLSAPDRAKAQSMIAGTKYLRLDVPCRYGRGGFGIAASIHHLESLLEVSPTGFSIERKLAQPSKYKRSSVFWGLSPNNSVHYGKLLFKGDTVQVWMEGDSPNNYEFILDFIHIQNLDDFTKAFNLTFSQVPLQEEHLEWPAQVRQAIAAHKVVVGMTREQVYAVVGSPLKIATGDENGRKTETWFPRQDRATLLAAGATDDTPTGFPARLSFTGEILQVIEQTQRTAGSGGN